MPETLLGKSPKGLKAPSGERPKLTTARSAYTMMGVATLGWSANVVITKIAVVDFDPIALASIRVLGAAFIFTLMGLPVLRRQAGLLWRERKTFWWLAVTGPVLTQFLFISGIRLTSPIHAALMFCVGPVIVLLLSCWLRMEAFTLWKIFGALIAFCGVTVLSLEKSPFGHNGFGVGNLMILGGVMAFSIYTILAKKASVRHDTVTLNLFSYLIGASLVLPILGMSAPRMSWTTVPPVAWLAAGFMLVFGAVLPYWVYYKALENLTASQVAIFGYLQPLGATFWSLWILQERITGQMIVAAVLIIGGVYLAERKW